MARVAERVVQTPPASSSCSSPRCARLAGAHLRLPGLEQLRAEVAAIENGAAYRLSFVCDELREA